MKSLRLASIVAYLESVPCPTAQGAVAAVIGAAPNTGTLRWVIPRHVLEGVYYVAIGPLTGARRLEVSLCAISLQVLRFQVVRDPVPCGCSRRRRPLSPPEAGRSWPFGVP